MIYGGPPLLSLRGRPSISIFSLERLLFRKIMSSPLAEYIELFSTYRQSICLSHDKLDVLLCNSIYKSKRFIRLFDIFCWSKMSRNCKAVMGSSNCGLSLLWIKQKSDCFFYLSGLRVGDHCAINCCLDKLKSGRLLSIKIKLGRMVESSRCVSIVEATLPLP